MNRHLLLVTALLCASILQSEQAQQIEDATLLTPEQIQKMERYTIRRQTLKKAFEAAKHCDIYTVLKAAELLEKEYRNETDPKLQLVIHATLVNLYTGCPGVCQNYTRKLEMLLALQKHALATQEKDLEKQKKEMGIIE